MSENTQIIIVNSVSLAAHILFLVLMIIAVNKKKMARLYAVAPSLVALNRVIFLIVVLHRRIFEVNIFSAGFVNIWSVFSILYGAVTAVGIMIVILYRKD